MTRVNFKLQGFSQLKKGTLHDNFQKITIDDKQYNADQLKFDNPITGTLYGTLLNYKGEYEQLKPEMNDKPYQKPPEAPVLYIKPINTFSTHHNPIPLPEGEEQVQIGAALGLVVGQTATKVKAEEAYDYIKGYTIVNDVSLPISSYYRPVIKQKARDGFCPIGPWVVNQDEIRDPHNLAIKVSVNGEVKQENYTGNLIRPIPELVSEVTEFMTLYEGDVLLIGVPEDPPLAKEGDQVSIEIEQVGRLNNRVVHEDDVFVSEVAVDEAR
ncbi:fumarylacetoacetate hydrolase family protein [Alkalibacillus haloalkaliphilus]|uniref:fumarylacetoacetate hydrolase family protein n=1 Tax=Alkalibacillus haloalkaliphilus TaxID=94136 RepID=UPI0029357F4F|nr:fumarylacetoacetate hydrolase family protein [Alkalibacillus haloalkaliphilus]MDV2582424.1 fumarylacetoacetate hydrolase family protein [Alkalibacillus haloalkaliphilus]